MVLSQPPAHPEPPDTLAECALAIREVEGPWYRIHRKAHGPIYFGSSLDNRFNAPAHQFRVLYIARHEHGAFIETFGQDTGVRVVAQTELALRNISLLDCRTLRLIDLTGPGLARIGADNRLCDGDYQIARRWSLALWNHPTKIDGLLYRARHDPAQECAAIYDRVGDIFKTRHTWGCDSRRFESTLSHILDTYEFALF